MTVGQDAYGPATKDLHNYMSKIQKSILINYGLRIEVPSQKFHCMKALF
jgi:hypothetical protein